MLRAVLLLALCVSFVAASNWAILIAGSNGYWNYRHQADVSHAYQILRNKGSFQPDHIITFMYDDIANNPQNPVKGNIINKPGGPNVYAGVQIDYSGAACTAANVLAVLNGTATGKVLRSNENDNVFIFYSDHGAPGLVAMPVGDPLYADAFISTLVALHNQRKFKQMVIYIEACESGSMFTKLPADIKVYGASASNDHESSYAFYYDASRGTYLGDEFAVHWMEDSDVADFNRETIQQQVDLVRGQVKGSHVCQFGEMPLGQQTLGVFQAFHNGNPFASSQMSPRAPATVDRTAVSSRDVPLAILARQAENGNDEARLALEREISVRRHIDEMFDRLVLKVTGAVSRATLVNTAHREPNNFECLRESVSAFQRHCGMLQSNDYMYAHVHKLVTLCEEGFMPFDVEAAAATVCN